MATIREIAERAGFSPATVSRILNDDSSLSVKEATRQKVLNASLELGYENVPRYQRVTIPQDIALLDNAVPDKGLQDMYSNELKAFLYQHAEDERMHITEYRNVNDLIKNKGKHAGFISIGPAPFGKDVLLLFSMEYSSILIRHQTCLIRCNQIWNKPFWTRWIR